MGKHEKAVHVIVSIMSGKFIICLDNNNAEFATEAVTRSCIMQNTIFNFGRSVNLYRSHDGDHEIGPL